MSLQMGKSSDENPSSPDSSEEGDDQDEPSSFGHQRRPPDSDDDDLNDFRVKWQQELHISSPNHNNSSNKTTSSDSNDLQIPDDSIDFETKAKMLYMNGVEMEKIGKLYEAIQYYRRAVQLVPDIEFRIDNTTKPLRDRHHISSVAEDRQVSQDEGIDERVDSDDESDEEFAGWELLARIQRKLSRKSTIFMPVFQQKTTHISVLPMEMILYILKWLVSSDLDMRSLELCSMVCRGFYQCARDPEIWRLACIRVWGMNCGSSPKHYLSWRTMFIDRTRLNFNGCYIGKITYFRHGENSFQDQFHRPWHLVAYYRYLRFFPDGLVLVLTSSDEPAQCVGQMKYRNARSPVLKGYYRLKDDRVTLIVQRDGDDNIKKSTFKSSNKRRDNLHESAEQTFHMELQIKNNKQKQHFQLIWKHYSVLTRTLIGDESTCNFDIVANRFPPFWFSRVRSYTSESDSPLQ